MKQIDKSKMGRRKLYGKRIFGIIILVNVFSFLESQNLVPNYSFENDTACPDNANQIYYAVPWYSPTPASPDYLNACSSNIFFSVPNNYNGEQMAHSGFAYAGVVTFVTSGYREYIQVKLTDSLIASKFYCVQFFVSLAGNSNYSSTRPQLYFSDSAIGSSSVGLLPYPPQIENFSTLISDTTNWILIDGYYLAGGGEKYITIGNFYDNANTQYDTIKNNGIPSSYYYIDDISVMECDTSDTTHYPIYDSYNIFANPSDGNFHLTGNFSAETQLHIYNMLGQEVMEPIALPEGNNSVPVFTQLAEGVYVCRILSGKEEIYCSKLVIWK